MDRPGDAMRNGWGQQHLYFDPPSSDDGSFAFNEATLGYIQSLYSRNSPTNGGYGLSFTNEARMPRTSCPFQGGGEYQQNAVLPQTPDFRTSGHNPQERDHSDDARFYEKKIVQMIYDILSKNREEENMLNTITSLERRNQELEELILMQVQVQKRLRDEIISLQGMLEEHVCTSAVQGGQVYTPVSNEGSCLT